MKQQQIACIPAQQASPKISILTGVRQWFRGNLRSGDTTAAALACLTLVCAAVLTGCAKNGGGGSGTGTAPPSGPTDFTSLSGNWLLTGASKAATPAPITMSGVIAEQAATGASRFTTTVLQVQAPCYANTQIVPLDGQTTAARYQAASFNVQGQILTLDAQPSADALQLTGTYAIMGGCADGQTGSFTGQRYADLTGTYVGTSTAAPGKMVSIAVAQDDNGTGMGTFLLTGTAQFAGFSCFTSGQIPIGAGSISGSHALIQFTANDQAHSQIALDGQIDAAAQALTLTASGVIGGSCAGDLGQFVLHKQ